LIIGFVLWQLASASYSSASNDIAQETQQRTIEQLCLTPITLPQLLGIRAFLHVLLGLFVFVLVWTLVYWLTGGRLKGDFVFIVAIAALAVPSLVGVGYAMAGLLLLVKRAEIMHALIYLALISLVALPAYPVNAFSLLPYALGAATAKEVAAGGIVPIAVYGLIAVNSLAYLVIGIGTFIQLERRTRELGTLGHS
jgi:ABC-2 type transport system permease protein